MTERQALDVFVRAAALYWIGHGLINVVYGSGVHSGLLPSAYHDSFELSYGWILQGIFNIVAGLLLALLAKWIVNCAYFGRQSLTSQHLNNGNEMNARNIFSVTVRAVGLWFGASGLWRFVMASESWGLARHGGLPPNVVEPEIYLIQGALSLTLGMYLLRGAPLLMRFAYGKEAIDK